MPSALPVTNVYTKAQTVNEEEPKVPQTTTFEQLNQSKRLENQTFQPVLKAEEIDPAVLALHKKAMNYL